MSDFNVAKLREDFPILLRNIHDKPLVYLDSAATTLKPQKVVDHIARHYLLETANVHRGVHQLSEQATVAFECTRTKTRAFLHADYDHEIIFTRGTTESINIVAQSYGRKFLKEGDEILISHMEHHSNIVPWQMLCEEKGCVLKVIPITDEGELDMQAFDRMLTDKVKFVSVVHTSNSLGTINPIKKVIEKAHALHIPVLVDGAQSVSHDSINVKELDCDFFVFSGHKMFGPTGVGVLYGKAKFLEEMPPVQGGGDMILSVTFDKTTYNELPYKFEAGTPHIAGVIGLGEAIDYIGHIGLDRIFAYEQTLLNYGTEVLSQIDGLRLIGTAQHKVPVFSFVLDGIHPHDIGTIVDEEAVAIRTGHHCTQPVMDRFKVAATARASLAMYNTKEDIDALARAIKKVQHVFK